MAGIGATFTTYRMPVAASVNAEGSKNAKAVETEEDAESKKAQVLASIGIKAAEMALGVNGMASREPEPVAIYGELADADAQIKGALSDAGINQSFLVYDGVYEITPKNYSQTLDTANKILVDDVLVHKVPYWETSNSAGGLTAYIANE